jgi:hypothetical protein
MTTDKNLKHALEVCDTIAHFKVAIEKEMKDHPDYKADCLCMDSEGAYIVLNRFKNDVKHSIDVEVEYGDGGE